MTEPNADEPKDNVSALRRHVDAMMEELARQGSIYAREWKSAPPPPSAEPEEGATP